MSDPLWVNAGRGDSVGPATISATTDQVTITAHGLNNSQPVMVAALSGGAVGVLREDTIYYVVNSAADTFQLVSAPGDEVIAFGSDGAASVYTAAPSYDAAELRRAFSFLLTQGVADRFGARSGVHPAGLAAVSLSGTTWTVHDTKAVVYPGLSSLDGPYVVQLPSESGSLNPAHASLSRTDAIDIQVQDDDHDASGFRRARAVYVPGTAGGGEPALTPTAFRMARFTVPAGGAPAPTMIYVAPYTVASGGVLPVRNDAEGPSTGRYHGQVRYRQDIDTMEVYDGSAWVPLAHVGGWETIYNGDIANNDNISIDPGVYDTIRLELRGSLTTLGRVTMRVNNDSTTDLHRLAWTVYNHVGGTHNSSSSTKDTTWPIAQWGTADSNVAQATIYRTHQSGLLSFRGGGARATATDADRQFTVSSGSLGFSRLLSSLRFGAFPDQIGSAYLVLEGHRSR